MRKNFLLHFISGILLASVTVCVVFFKIAEPALAVDFDDQVAPRLSVPIPDLNFSNITVTTSTVDGIETSTLDVPYLSQYIGALYKFAVAVSGILAIVMMMVGGFQYLIARDTGLTKQARTQIVNALIGLGLTIFAFVILNTINPDLVNLRSTQVTVVRPVTFDEELLDAFGSAGDQSWDTNPLADTLPASVGGFRQAMQDVCGNKDGASLATYEQKIDRLKNIVSVWASVGANQGGGVYIRGGNWQCTWSCPQPNYALAILSKVTSSLSPSMSPQCKDFVLQVAAAEGDKKKFADNLAKANPGTLKYDCAAPAGCYKEIRDEYERIFMRQAGASGLLCGDCASMVANLYECFDKSMKKAVSQFNPIANRCTLPPSGGNYVPGCTLTNPTRAQIDTCISNLRFGDTMGTNAHVFMYTGGAGLGFDMLEMGGGGRADITCADCGGKLASQIAGFPGGVTLSGMRATVRVEDFLKKYVGAKCLWAWRPIQP